MPDSHTVSRGLPEAVLEATLNELGGEPLAGSGFELELPIDLDEEPKEGDAQ
jgi:hypothetical protein